MASVVRLMTNPFLQATVAKKFSSACFGGGHKNREIAPSS
jgi:hypothetical protein